MDGTETKGERGRALRVTEAPICAAGVLCAVLVGCTAHRSALVHEFVSARETIRNAAQGSRVKLPPAELLEGTQRELIETQLGAALPCTRWVVVDPDELERTGRGTAVLRDSPMTAVDAKGSASGALSTTRT